MNQAVHGEFLSEENKQGKSNNCPNSLPRESFQAVAQGGGIQAEPNSLLKLGRGSWESREATGARVCRAEKRELHKERALEMCRGPPSSFQLSTGSNHQN